MTKPERNPNDPPAFAVERVAFARYGNRVKVVRDPWVLRLRLTVGVLAAAAGGFLHFSGMAGSLDLQLTNWLFRHVGTRFEPDPRICILAIDDASLRLMEPVAGRWPWPRHHLARLVDSCRGAASVSLDILLPEADRGAGEDETLASAIRENGHVALAGAFVDDLTEAPHAHAVPSLHFLEDTRDPSTRTAAYLMDQFLMPVPILAKACRAIGHANFFPSPDHLLRAYPYAIASDQGRVPSLALAALQAEGTGQPADLALGSDASSTELVFYRRPFRRISAADLLFRPQTPEGRLDWARDQYVFVGLIAAGAHEWRATPLSADFPGVEVHATALSNRFQGIRVRGVPPPLILGMVLAAAVLPLLPWNVPLRQWAAAVTLILAAGLGLQAAAFYLLPLRAAVCSPLAACLAACVGRVLEAAAHERQRRRMLEELQQMKRMLANMLLHDLNAPLSSMIMMLETTLPEQAPEGRAGRRIRNAIDEARRLSGILRNLLDIERMESGRMQVTSAPVAWERLVADTTGRLAPLARGREITLHAAIPPGLQWPGDASMLERVLLNLLDNAIRHAPQGTEVRVAVDTPDSEPSTLRCRVLNRGTPIPAELQAGLFQPYRTGLPSLTISGRGRFGLGLAYCRLAIAAHGGHIDCVSPAPGSADGACFEFHLPTRVPGPALPPPP